MKIKSFRIVISSPHKVIIHCTIVFIHNYNTVIIRVI